MRRFIIASLLIVLVLAGCSTAVDLSAVEHPLLHDDYAAALSALRGYGDELAGAQGEIVASLDFGMLNHYVRNHEDAIEYLTGAERKIDDAFTKSFTREAATRFINDNAQEYPGEDFEDIYVNVFKALDYQALGKTEDAMVEIRRSSEKQQVLKNKYQQLLVGMEERFPGGEYPPQAESVASVEFTTSALGSYLGMLFSRGLGDTVDMKYYNGQVKEAFATQPTLFPFAFPSSLDEELSVPDGKARVNFVAFSGREPEKREEVQRVFLFDGRWVKYALPVLTPRNSVVASVRAKIGKQEIVLEPIESLSSVAINTFELKKQSIYTRSVLRSTMKALGTKIVDGVSHTVLDDSQSGERSALADFLTFFSTISNDASEQADLRMSHFFPGRASVGGLTVEPGVYDISIGFYDAGGQKIAEVIHQRCKVESGVLNLCEGVCLR